MMCSSTTYGPTFLTWNKTLRNYWSPFKIIDRFPNPRRRWLRLILSVFYVAKADVATSLLLTIEEWIEPYFMTFGATPLWHWPMSGVERRCLALFISYPHHSWRWRGMHEIIFCLEHRGERRWLLWCPSNEWLWMWSCKFTSMCHFERCYAWCLVGVKLRADFFESFIKTLCMTRQKLCICCCCTHAWLQKLCICCCCTHAWLQKLCICCRHTFWVSCDLWFVHVFVYNCYV